MHIIIFKFFTIIGGEENGKRRGNSYASKLEVVEKSKEKY
jgi:hypothetical protein